MNAGTAERGYGFQEGEGDARWWLGSLATIKATGKETGGLYTLIEVTEPEGAEAPLHVHHREDEGFWILQGELTFQIGEEALTATAGSFVFGPKGVPHTYRVDAGPAKILFILSPAGFEDLLHATSEPARSLTVPLEDPPTEAEMERLASVVREYGAEILG